MYDIEQLNSNKDAELPQKEGGTQILMDKFKVIRNIDQHLSHSPSKGLHKESPSKKELNYSSRNEARGTALGKVLASSVPPENSEHVYTSSQNIKYIGATQQIPFGKYPVFNLEDNRAKEPLSIPQVRSNPKINYKYSKRFYDPQEQPWTPDPTNHPARQLDQTVGRLDVLPNTKSVLTVDGLCKFIDSIRKGIENCMIEEKARVSKFLA